MMHNVGKNMAVVAWLAVMAGCGGSSMEEPMKPQADLVPVIISANTEAMTRADGTFVNSVFTSGKQMGVFGYAYSSATWQSSSLPNFFNNQPMTLEDSGSTSGLTYSPVAYWPSEGRKLAAFGYYPYSGDASNIVPNVSSGLGTFTYTTPLAASDQTDFMVTPLVTDKTSSDNPLNLTLYHTLACIEISVDLSGTEFSSISSAKVLNVRTKGMFNPTVFNDDINNYNDDWRTTAWITESEVEDVNIDKLPASGSLTVTDETRLLLIPQQCYPSLHRIELTLVRSADGSTVTTSYGLTEKWKAGNVYQYNITGVTLSNPGLLGNAGGAIDGGIK
ncbi:MAG: fimbrillin family protein [Bacteroidaceae bacterium]|nr:fimbrillin family protein [Bacteroidaceae bacterium]